MPVDDLFVPDLHRVLPGTNGDQLDGRRQSVLKLCLHLGGEVGALVQRGPARGQLHGEGEAGGEAAFLAVLLACFGQSLDNIGSLDRHSESSSISMLTCSS